jgi:hypothetical protein
MALPSRDQTFAYENCRDLVEKLDREIDRYCEVAGTDDTGANVLDLVHQLTDSAFNAAVTAWHLCDWVFNDLPTEQRKKLGFKKLAKLQEHAKEQCRALYLCRYAATASKHWAVESNPDPTINVVVAHENGWTIFFVDQGKKITAQQVFEAARDFWHQFIRENDISKALDARESEGLSMEDTD